MPLGPVVLPQSITQEAEDERLKKRFGVEYLPEVDKRHNLVGLTQSEGASGPDRARRGAKVFLLLLLLGLAGAGYVAYSQGMLDKLLGGM